MSVLRDKSVDHRIKQKRFLAMHPLLAHRYIRWMMFDEAVETFHSLNCTLICVIEHEDDLMDEFRETFPKHLARWDRQVVQYCGRAAVRSDVAMKGNSPDFVWAATFGDNVKEASDCARWLLKDVQECWPICGLEIKIAVGMTPYAAFVVLQSSPSSEISLDDACSPKLSTDDLAHMTVVSSARVTDNAARRIYEQIECEDAFHACDNNRR